MVSVVNVVGLSFVLCCNEVLVVVVVEEDTEVLAIWLNVAVVFVGCGETTKFIGVDFLFSLPFLRCVALVFFFTAPLSLLRFANVLSLTFFCVASLYNLFSECIARNHYFFRSEAFTFVA